MFNFSPGPTPLGNVQLAAYLAGDKVAIRVTYANGQSMDCFLDADSASQFGRRILELAGEIEPSIDWPEDLGDTHDET